MGTAITIVVNPAAAGGRDPQRLQTIRTAFDAAGVHYLTRYSKSLRHACVLAAEAAVQGHNVAAVGGNGMAGAVAGAVAQAKPTGDSVFAIGSAPSADALGTPQEFRATPW
jgi:diacylglycerol kinase (ATP)